MVVAELFPRFRHMIISDVDVVYRDDISAAFLNFQRERDYWMAGIGYCRSDLPCEWIERVFEHCYDEGFSEEERRWLSGGIGGGYIICNLEKMRSDKASEHMLNTFHAFASRLKQAEQDVINLAGHGKLKRLPIRNMVSNCFYEHLTNDEKLLWADTLAKPVQLHYVSNVKPWNSPGCAMAHIWWHYLSDTPFYYEIAKKFDQVEKISLCKFFGLRIAKIWHTGAIGKARFINSIPMHVEERF